MGGKGSVGKWLLCGELSVSPELTSGLLSENLPHRVSPPILGGSFERGIPAEGCGQGPFSEGSTLP